MLRLLTVVLTTLMLAAPGLAQEPEADLTLQHDSGVVTASWNADEGEILTATESGVVQVWSADSGESLLTIEHGESPVTHALWLDGGAAILSADESGLVMLSGRDDGRSWQRWQLDGRLVALEANDAGTSALAFTPVGGALLSLEDGGLVAEFDTTAIVSGAALSADETRARAWSEDGTVYSWLLTAGEAQEARPPHGSLLLGALWNADDTRVLAWFADGLVNLYESDGVSLGRGRISGRRHNSFVQQAVWSADETRVMSWAGDDTVHIWAADTGRSQEVYRHEDWVIGARWDADEERVLSWSHIYVYLWKNEREWQRYRHGNLVRGASWNHAGTKMLSWSWDGTARVWQA